MTDYMGPNWDGGGKKNPPPLRHTCIKDDGGTPNRKCYACEADGTFEDHPVKVMDPPLLEQASTTAEVRVTDPITGGMKGDKLQRYDLIPAEFLWDLAEVFGRGVRKYEDRNWEKGYAWHLSYAALQRHLNQWVMGESLDAETGAHHLCCAAWHLSVLHHFERFGKGTDDLRRKPTE